MPLFRFAVAALCSSKSSDLKAVFLLLSRVLTSRVIQGLWLAYTWMHLSAVTVTVVRRVWM